MAAVAGGPGGEEAGGRAGAGRQQRGGLLRRLGEPEDRDVLPGEGGGQDRPGGLPGPVRVREDARRTRPGAGAADQGNPRRREGGGGQGPQRAVPLAGVAARARWLARVFHAV